MPNILYFFEVFYDNCWTYVVEIGSIYQKKIVNLSVKN